MNAYGSNLDTKIMLLFCKKLLMIQKFQFIFSSSNSISIVQSVKLLKGRGAEQDAMFNTSYITEGLGERKAYSTHCFFLFFFFFLQNNIVGTI